MAATGAAAVIIAPAAMPPPTVEPIAAIPDDIAAPPARPEAPAADANAAPVVPAVADMIVAADPPTTADAVLAAVPTVAKAPAAPTAVDIFASSDISLFSKRLCWKPRYSSNVKAGSQLQSAVKPMMEHAATGSSAKKYQEYGMRLCLLIADVYLEVVPFGWTEI